MLQALAAQAKSHTEALGHLTQQYQEACGRLAAAAAEQGELRQQLAAAQQDNKQLQQQARQLQQQVQQVGLPVHVLPLLPYCKLDCAVALQLRMLVLARMCSIPMVLVQCSTCPELLLLLLLLTLLLQLQQELSASAAAALAAAQSQHEQQLLAVQEQQQGMVQQAKQELAALTQQLKEQVRRAGHDVLLW
jgi:hypothetical protein